MRGAGATNIRLFCAVVLPIALAFTPGPHVAAAESGILNSSSVPAGYRLTFDDEFKTLSISDADGAETKWYSQTIRCCLRDTSAPSTPAEMGRMSSPPGQNPFSLVSGGGLDIRLQKTDGKWYSGVIATVDNTGKGFSQQYGYFEMKARFPSGPGPWPAFWLLNTAATAHHAGSGEIDVLESYMFAPAYVNVAIHDWSHHKTLGYTGMKSADLTVGFHTFGFLWTAEMMTFYCDGVVVYRFPTPPIMKQPYYAIVDLGLGGGWPTKHTRRVSDMVVKYVRVYAAPPASGGETRPRKARRPSRVRPPAR